MAASECAVHIGFTASMGRFDLKWNPNSDVFSPAVGNHRVDKTPMIVASLQLAVVDPSLLEEDLDSESRSTG